jgi:1A family penicillin-binding protein
MKNKFINKLYIIDIPTQSEIEIRSFVKKVFYISILFLLCVSSIISAMISLEIIKNAKQLPDVAMLKEFKPDQSTLIFDINNKLVANIHGDEDRVVVPLDKISPNLQRAVIAIEDNRFYEHKGIDLTGISRAVFKNLSGGSSIQGGSSITQQLIKNSFLSSERSIKRKLLEALLAIYAERIFDKKQILEMYLNQIYWGNLSYGAEKAARRYFKIPASELDLAQSAFLAGIIKAPEGYSPYQNIKLAKLRQKAVLEKMEYYGYITPHQKMLAEKQQLKFATRQQLHCKYPYYVDYVSYVLRKTYGDDIIRRGGLKVYTTLDPTAQELAEKTVAEGVKSTPKGSGVRQGAIVSIDVNSGYVIALVGGIDYDKSNYNRAVYSKRAAGSSFKPIVYLTGLRLGKITPESSILDAPISFNTGWNIWCPHNWDGKYMGKMTIRKALALSRNTATVRIALKVGIDSIIETARKLGIKSKINRDYSIALGSLGLSPLEMATVYSTLARQGVYIEPTCIRKIIDGQGNTIEVHSSNPIQVVNPNYVRQLDSILIDVVDKGTGVLAKLNDRPVAGKTGTTDEVKDIWFTGFTPDTVTAVWLGNDENQGLKGVFSSNCAQLWGIYMKEYYLVKNIPPQYFPQADPDDIEKLKKLEIAGMKEKNKVKISKKPCTDIKSLKSNYTKIEKDKNITVPETQKTKIAEKNIKPYNPANREQSEMKVDETEAVENKQEIPESNIENKDEYIQENPQLP